MLIVSGIRSVFLVFEKQEKAFLFSGLSLLIRLGALIICARYMDNLFATVLIFSVGSGIIEAVKLLYIVKLIKINLLALLSEIKYYLVSMFVIALSVILLRFLTGWSDLWIFSACIVLGAAYYLLLLITQPTLKSFVLSLVRKSDL
jgi:hypothetical protein